MGRDHHLVILTTDGVTSDPTKMAKALDDRWSAAFSAKPTCNHHTRKAWLQDNAYGLRSSATFQSSQWDLTQRHVELAVKYSNNSPPGLDGIPYGAWRQLGHVGVATIHAAASRMQDDDFSNEELPYDFNVFYLCCLPKKPTGNDPTEGDYFSPSATRPLSLVNTDNRGFRPVDALQHARHGLAYKS